MSSRRSHKLELLNQSDEKDVGGRIITKRKMSCVEHSDVTNSKVHCRVDLEEDETILKRREKQIEYGKNTLAYDRYTELVKKSKRTKKHPSTPDKKFKYSRRQWDGLIKAWRLAIHKYSDLSKPESTGEQADTKVDETDSCIYWADEVEFMDELEEHQLQINKTPSSTT